MATRKKADKKPAKARVIHIESSVDELVELACRAVFEEGKVSTSLIQRRLGIGYARAAHLLDLMRELKIVSEDPGKPATLKSKVAPILKRREAKPDKIDPVPAAKNPGGKPSIYTDKLVHTICMRIAYGESLRQICRDEEIPAMSTVMDWLLDEKKEDFRKKYQAAREMQAEVLFDETLEIADDGSNDWMEREIGRGRVITVFDNEHAQRSKLRVETRKWFISKVLPKKFGEKLDLSSGGKPIKNPRPAVINYIMPKAPAKT